MKSQSVRTVDEYMAQLPAERRAVVAAVRDVVRTNLPAGYAEAVGFGMITWTVPLARFPNTYNGQPLCYAALAAQKHHVALYLMGAYGDATARAALEQGFAAAGKRLDMGQSCVRFMALDDLPLAVIARSIASMPPERMIAMHEAAHSKDAVAARRAARREAAPAKRATKKAATRKTAMKKSTAKKQS